MHLVLGVIHHQLRTRQSVIELITSRNIQFHVWAVHNPAFIQPVKFSNEDDST